MCPTPGINWLMAIIAIAAFDFGVIRALLNNRTPKGDLLLVGAVPMANVLAVGMLIGQRRCRSRAFLLGFETFGAVALVIYVYLATFSHRVLWAHLSEPLINYVGRSLGTASPLVHISVLCSAATIILVLPQVTFALVGGLLSRRFGGVGRLSRTRC